jgi:hypothetical protein
MKAKLVDSLQPGDWIYEIKFDGYRALALRGGNETRILSRNQKDLGKKFPEIVDAMAFPDVQDAVIDGEIVALDDRGRPSFQLLIKVTPLIGAGRKTHRFNLNTRQRVPILVLRATEVCQVSPENRLLDMMDSAPSLIYHACSTESGNPF